MTTQELQQVAHTANSDYNRKRNERATYINLRMEEERKRVDQAADDIYGAELKRLGSAFNDANDALVQRKHDEAQAGVGAEHPVGTRMVEWGLGGWRYWERGNVKVKTGRTGIYIGITRDTIMPNNLSDWGRPKIGDFAIQITKKDGKQGVQLIQRHDMSDWYPEGVDPNAPVPVSAQ